MSVIMDVAHLFSAIKAAQAHEGATAPNPPVGAVLVSKDGRVLAAGAHERAGLPHAEINAITAATNTHGASAFQGATLYVTLEPCNHTGRTPLCTEAIIRAGIKHVVIGCQDPNPKVAGGGAQRLVNDGIKITWATGAAAQASRDLMAAFRTLHTLGRPYVLHKLVYRPDPGHPDTLTLLPPKGATTFSHPESLTLAHQERRRADAILTGIGTVLADNPQFTVRHVTDHQNRTPRPLAVIADEARLTRNPKDYAVYTTWATRQKSLGYEPLLFATPRLALEELGRRGCLRVLAECGPELSEILRKQGLWDERLVVTSGRQNCSDIIVRSHKEVSCSQASSPTPVTSLAKAKSRTA